MITKATMTKPFNQLRPGERFRLSRGGQPGGTVFVKVDEHQYQGEISKRTYDLREMSDPLALTFGVWVERAPRVPLASELPSPAQVPVELDLLLELWRQVSAQQIPTGGFLRKFGEAYVHADIDNRILLAPSAFNLAAKYKLFDKMLLAESVGGR